MRAENLIIESYQVMCLWILGVCRGAFFNDSRKNMVSTILFCPNLSYNSKLWMRISDAFGALFLVFFLFFMPKIVDISKKKVTLHP